MSTQEQPENPHVPTAEEQQYQQAYVQQMQQLQVQQMQQEEAAKQPQVISYAHNQTQGADSLNNTISGQLNTPLNSQTVEVTIVTISNDSQLLQEDETVKDLLCGPTKTRNFTDIWAAVLFGCVCTIFFVMGIVAFTRSKPFSDNTGSSGNAYGVGFGAVFTTFVVSFVVGLGMQVLLMRFTYYILLGSLASVFVMLGIFAIYCIAALKNVGAFVVCLLFAAVYFFIAFGVYKKLPILDKISKLAFEFTVEVAGQYILLAGFTFIILVEIIWYIIGLIHLVYAANENGQENYNANINFALAYIFFSVWMIGTTQQAYKFCISFMSCLWFFGKNEDNTILNTIRMTIRHIGSLSFSTLVCMLLGYVTIFLKIFEKMLNSCCLFCISAAIKTCRRSLMKIISSLTIVSIAHKGNNFCQGMTDISAELASEPFYYLFVIWGADYVSGIVGFFSFFGGFVIGLIIIYSQDTLHTTNVAVIFFILTWTVAAEVADLFTTTYRMILYSIGSFYNICSKYRGGVLVEKYKSANVQIEEANKGSNLQVKDIN